MQVDLADFSGPDYKGVDKRCVALRLVEKGLCDAALFSPSGKLQPALTQHHFYNQEEQPRQFPSDVIQKEQQKQKVKPLVIIQREQQKPEVMSLGISMEANVCRNSLESCKLDWNHQASQRQAC